MNGSVNSSGPRAIRPPVPPENRTAISLLIGVSGWAVLGITTLTGPGLVRSIAVFAFALIVPGLAVTRLLPLRDAPLRTVLSIALSMSLSALVAEALAIAHRLRPALALIVLATLCTAAAAADVARRE